MARPRTLHRAPTTFQQRVYNIACRIPAGRVRSYRWVAEQLGNPHLARAVGQALKHNRDPQRIPCHRVIRADGSLGGYAWGVRRKQRLLAQETRQVGRPLSSSSSRVRLTEF